MAARDPNHPDERVDDVERYLHGVDLSGGASTVGRDADAMTLGADSLGKAFAGGFGARPSTNGPTPRDVEKRAHKKGLTRAGRLLRNGEPPDSAFARGFAKYRKHGGKHAYRAWIRKCAR